MRNTGDAISMLQTAEGAFNEMTDIVQRMKDLATQGANGTNSAHDLSALQNEYNELGNELANIIKNTKYAGESLFSDGTVTDGSDGKFAAEMSFQIGASASETLALDASGKLTSLTAALTAISTNYEDDTTGVEIADVDLTATPPTITTNTANATITLLETALNEIGAMRATLGANINRLNHTNNNLANMKDNTDMSKGRITDADFAKESANMSKNSMLMQSGISMLKQAGQMPGMVMSLLG
jgi:flagellin